MCCLAPLCRPTSAKQIIACIANSNKRLKSRIQQQMVDEGKSIQDTDAGRFLYDQWAAERVTLSQNIVEMERILQRAIG